MVRIVSFEASIGCGKTSLINTLIEKTKDDKTFILVDEPVDDWKNIKVNEVDILSAFYSDMKEVALPFQIIALLTRRRKIMEKIEEAKLMEKEFGKEIILVTERTVHSDHHIFARMLHDDGIISDWGMKAYEMWNEDFSKESTVNKTVYITTPPDVCYRRVKERNRPGEEKITLEYLQGCQKAHDRFYTEHISKGNYMIVDTTNIIKGTPEFDKLVSTIIDYFKN